MVRRRAPARVPRSVLGGFRRAIRAASVAESRRNSQRQRKQHREDRYSNCHAHDSRFSVLWCAAIWRSLRVRTLAYHARAQSVNHPGRVTSWAASRVAAQAFATPRGRGSDETRGLFIHLVEVSKDRARVLRFCIEQRPTMRQEICAPGRRALRSAGWKVTTHTSSRDRESSLARAIVRESKVNDGRQ